MLHASLLGGLFIGVLSALPIVSIGNCCCLWIVGGGFLAAYVNQQNDPRPFSVSRGVMVGLGAGVVGAVVFLVASLALDAVLAPLQQRVLGELAQSTRDMPPEAKAFLRSMMEGGPLRHVIGFAIMLFFGTPFAMLGGVLGAAFFRPDVPPALGGPIELPPPPSLP